MKDEQADIRPTSVRAHHLGARRARLGRPARPRADSRLVRLGRPTRLAAEIEVIFGDYADADDSARVLRFRAWGIASRWWRAGAETVVRLVRPAPSPDTDWDEFFEDITQGWIAFFRQLQFALDRHPGGGRRTLLLLRVAAQRRCPAGRRRARPGRRRPRR